MKHFLLGLLILTSLTRVFAEEKSKAPASWPNWMGPNFDGISAEKIPTQWPESGLDIEWTQSIGIGFSSMCIEENRLYTMGHKDGKEYVYCLDSKTGDQIWDYSYPCQLVDVLHEGGPGATPTIDDNFIYTIGREGQFYCFNKMNGKIIWSKMLQEDLEEGLPEWGFTTSAYILDDQVILVTGRVVSYNKKSGEKNWQTSKREAGYGTAISFEHEGSTLVAALDCDGLRIVSSKNGDELATFPWDSPYRTNSTTPIIQGNKIFISTGYNVGGALLELKNNSLKQIYKSRKMRNHFNNSILYKGYLYGFDGNSNLGRVVSLTCMDFATGEVAWKQRGYGCGSLMIVDGKLLVLSEKGKLALVEASPDGFKEITQSPFLDGRCWTVPIYFNGKIYGRNAVGKLVCAKTPAH